MYPAASQPRTVPVATVDAGRGFVTLALSEPAPGFRCTPGQARELAAHLERAAFEAEAPRYRGTRAPLPPTPLHAARDFTAAELLGHD